MSVNPHNIAASADGLAYSRWNQKGGLAANYSYIQIWNPAASGKLLAVTQVGLTSTSKATFLGYLGSTKLSTSVLADGISLSDGVAGGVAEFWAQHSTSGTLAAASAFDLSSEVIDDTIILEFHDPIIVREGSGLAYRPSATDRAISAFYRYRELAA